MAYARKDEQETLYNYSPIDGCWIAESSYPPHIRQIYDRCEIISTVTDEQGRIIHIRARADRNQLRLFQPRL